MEFSSGREKWNSKLFRIVNSAMAYGIAYVLLQSGYFLITAAAANSYGIISTVTFHSFTYSSPIQDWFKKSVVLSYSSGLLFLLMSAAIGLLVYWFTKKYDSPLRLIFLWLAVLGITMSGAEVLNGALGLSDFHSPFYQGFAIAMAWLYVQPIIAFVAAAFFLFSILASGVLFTRLFLQNAYSYRKVEKLKNRRKYFVEIAMVPALIGLMYETVLVFPEKYIFCLVTHLVYVVVFVVSGWYILFYVSMHYDDVNRQHSLQKISIVLLLLFMAATYWAAVVMDKGIKFN